MRKIHKEIEKFEPKIATISDVINKLLKLVPLMEDNDFTEIKSIILESSIDGE